MSEENAPEENDIGVEDLMATAALGAALAPFKSKEDKEKMP